MALKDLLRDVQSREDVPSGILLGLNRYLTRRRMLPYHSTKPPAWYPSSIANADFCPRAGVLGRIHEVRVDPLDVTNELDRILDIGHWLHRGYQEEYLGPMGILWGDWRCSRCHSVVTGFMPKDPCPRCQWVGTDKDLTASSCYVQCCDAANRRDPAQIKKRGGCVRCGKWGRWEYLEMPVEIKELGIRGRIDGLLALEPYGDPEIVWDGKTMNKRRFGPIKAVGPGERDKKQLMLYLLGLKKKRGLLTYIEKDAHGVAEFEIPYDASFIRREIAMARLMNGSLADGTVPKRSMKCKSPQSARAKKCSIAATCFSERPHEKKDKAANI